VIVQWFMQAVNGLISGIFSVMPPLPVPAWFTGAGTALANLFGAATSMGVWIPIPLALNVMATLFAAMFGGALIKLGRIVLSFLTAGGGSAA
jgi:hypothetical protein